LHGLPHAPQCCSEDCRFAHPVAQQVSVPVSHVTPQAPQCIGDESATQVPPQHRSPPATLHAVHESPQRVSSFGTQEPPQHTCPGVHATAVAQVVPQRVSSVRVSVQMALQQVSGAVHDIAHMPQRADPGSAHMPSQQMSVVLDARQSVVQVPQWL
jgi:hypothetical protein